MIDLMEIGNRRMQYQDKNKCQFEATPEDYLQIARKTIAHFAPRFSPHLAKKMLSSEDIVSNIATDLMLADWRWSSEYRSKNGTVRTRRAYRNQCALWSIKGHIGRLMKHQKHKVYSLDTNIGHNNSAEGKDVDFAANLPDTHTLEPFLDAASKERDLTVKETIDAILSSSILTPQQSKFIRMYYLEERTLASIGKECGITREAVRQAVARGIEKLRSLAS